MKKETGSRLFNAAIAVLVVAVVIIAWVTGNQEVTN